jgi:glyoxylase-like metal-dependent hydrolase (beta-lactamase superfamily II)
MEKTFFTAKKIAERTTLITGTAIDNCYLLEGDRYALLIDTMTGAGRLKEFCQTLTGAPVHVALTHGHPDHTGGCFEFGECHIHPDDVSIMYNEVSPERRLEFIKSMNKGLSSVVLSDMIPPCALKTYPVYGGDYFDLGDRRIEAIAVPGHTAGTLVFLDAVNRILFSGDACNTNTLLFMDKSVSIHQYLESLLRLKLRQAEFDKLWGGHGPEALAPRTIDEAIELCGRIIAGTDGAIPGTFQQSVCFYAREQTGEIRANIAYRKDWIGQAPQYRKPPLKPGNF